ncbi:MAG: magnesium transporter [Planctomycetota bacterium]
MLGRLIQPEIRELIEHREWRTLREVLVELSVQDAAEAFSEFSEEDKGLAFRLLPTEAATNVFERLDPSQQQVLLASLKDSRAASILNDMSPDDRTELLEEMPDRVARRVMRLLSPEEHAITRALLAYPEDSVGRLMTPHYVKVKRNVSVADCIQLLRKVAEEKETIYYVYMVDEANVPLGVVSLSELVFARPEQQLGKLVQVEDELVKIPANRDQEEAVQLLRHYDLMALPVVDNRGRLVGIVTVDDLMDVQEEEATEDMQLMSGVVPTERGYLQARFLDLFKNRALSLVALAITATFMGTILNHYHSKLEAFPGLVNFIIVLMAASGNTGIQAGTLVIRALATEEIRAREVRKIAQREIFMGALLGLTLGLVVAFIGVNVFDNVTREHAVVVGAALALAVMACNMVGVLFPVLLRALKLDPAFFSNPLITTISDLLALFIFFEMANACLQVL